MAGFIQRYIWRKRSQYFGTYDERKYWWFKKWWDTLYFNRSFWQSWGRNAKKCKHKWCWYHSKQCRYGMLYPHGNTRRICWQWRGDRSKCFRRECKRKRKSYLLITETDSRGKSCNRWNYRIYRKSGHNKLHKQCIGRLWVKRYGKTCKSYIEISWWNYGVFAAWKYNILCKQGKCCILPLLLWNIQRQEWRSYR